MSNYFLLGFLLFHIGVVQSSQAANDTQIEQRWLDGKFNVESLKQDYTRRCLSLEIDVEQNKTAVLCQLLADELLESTLHRSLTVDQYIEFNSCTSEESYSEDDCRLASDVESYVYRDALVASLCNMEPTLVVDGYHGSFIKRGSKIFNNTALLFECNEKWFVDNASYGGYTNHPTEIEFTDYPIIVENLEFSISNNREDEFSAQLKSLAPEIVATVGQPLLFVAIRADNPNYLTMLLEEGVNPNNSDDFFNQPLSAALAAGKDDAAATLLEYGASPNAFDRNGYSSVYLAAKHGSLETVSKLIDGGASVNGQLINLGDSSTPPLAMAAEYGRKDVLMRLLGEGASIELAEANLESYENILLSKAASSGNESLFQLLLSKGARIPDDHDKSLIEAAIEGGNAALLESLFSLGVEFPIDDNSDILFKLKNGAGRRENSDEYRQREERHYQRPIQFEMLVEQGLKLEYKENGAYDLITRLTSRYTIPAQIDDPIHRKVLAEKQALTLALIKHYAKIGLDLNYLESRETLLMDAVSGGYLEMVELLLELGADKDIETAPGSGITARDIAGRRLSEKIKRQPENVEEIAILKKIYILLDGELGELPEIPDTPEFSVENMLRNILQK